LPKVEAEIEKWIAISAAARRLGSARRMKMRSPARQHLCATKDVVSESPAAARCASFNGAGGQSVAEAEERHLRGHEVGIDVARVHGISSVGGERNPAGADSQSDSETPTLMLSSAVPADAKTFPLVAT